MSVVQLCFHGSEQSWAVEGDYDQFVKHYAACRASDDLLEVTLADGVHAKAGTAVRMMVSPRSVAFVLDMDARLR